MEWVIGIAIWYAIGYALSRIAYRNWESRWGDADSLQPVWLSAIIGPFAIALVIAELQIVTSASDWDRELWRWARERKERERERND